MLLFLKVFFTEFIAEMGDKTQLMLIALTSKYKLRDIILGTAAAILVLNGLAVLAGGLISEFIPDWLIKMIAAVAFLYFAASTIAGGDEEEEELKRQNLPIMQKGQEFSISDIRLTEGKTKPPARFTEGTLIAAMENPVRYMESSNKEMAKTLGETGGLGTVATRADIIEKLFSGFLLEKKGEDIYTTAKACQLLELVPEDLCKPELTAEWEMKLSKIAEGKLSDRKFMNEIRTYSTDLVKQIKTAEGTFRHDNMTNKLCPNCGKRLLAVNGKNSRMLVCQDRECGYRQTIAKTTNARCPQCHKRMELIGSGENASFVCKCGYKERLSKFQERRKKEGAGVSKRDVQNYLKKQQKEAKQETGSNAMLDALKNIKL